MVTYSLSLPLQFNLWRLRHLTSSSVSNNRFQSCFSLPTIGKDIKFLFLQLLLLFK